MRRTANARSLQVSPPEPSAPRRAARVAASDIPEVQQVLDLEFEIQSLKAEHPEVFLRYAHLVDRYNTALEAAEIVVRSRGISAGPFVGYSSSTRYDLPAMVTELGREVFLAIGGKVLEGYDLDRQKLEQALCSGKIRPEVLRRFQRVTRNYHKPKKLNAP